MDVLIKENNIFYNVLCFLITENEKLFDRSDAKLYWRTVLHIFGILHHVYVGLFASSLGLDLKISLDSGLHSLYKFRLGYLTGWNVVFQTIFLFLSLSHDVLEWAEKHQGTLARKLRYWRDVIFSGLVVPYTCFVFCMFWSLYSIDRELVFPKVYDEVVPWWFNQCVHSNILVMILVETILQPRRYPVDKKLELILNAACGILYAIVYYSIYFFAHRWLYNVFGIMTWWQVCIFQLCIWASSYIFYLLQFPINRLIHREEPEEQKIAVEVASSPAVPVETKNEEDNEEKGVNGANGISGTTTFKPTPFSTKSWSLKYRTIRSQFENSTL